MAARPARLRDLGARLLRSKFSDGAPPVGRGYGLVVRHAQGFHMPSSSLMRPASMMPRYPSKYSVGGWRLLSSSSKEPVNEKGNKFEKLKFFLSNQWQTMDSSSKFKLFELVAKILLLGFSGGWGAALAYSVIVRVDRSEVVMKDLIEALEGMKVRLDESEKRSEKDMADVEARFEELRLEMNELRSFKDLWIAYAFERENSSFAVPGTPEAKDN